MDVHVRVSPRPPGDPATLRAAYARYFRVLGDATRLEILQALLEGERTVEELVRLTGHPRSRLSNHLACLRWCGFVAGRRRGRHVLYRVVDPRLPAVLRAVGSLSPARCQHLACCRRIGPEWV